MRAKVQALRSAGPSDPCPIRRTDPALADVLAGVAARGFDDAERGSDVATAPRFSTTARSVGRWRVEGSPAVRRFLVFLYLCSDPLRLAMEVLAVAKLRAVSKKSTAQAIEDYRALLESECTVEAEDRSNDVRRGVTWAERARSSARDARVDAEKEALELLFQARGVTEAEVFGGRA